MGYGAFDHDTYRARQTHRANTGTDAFVHDRAIREGTATRGVHPQMNPHGVTRESRDSADHPESLAIGVMLDVTGSMQTIPGVVQGRLHHLMTLLTGRGYVEHPHLLFGAIGDANSDTAPLQVGQFESDLRMEDDLGRFFKEGGGGGGGEESYELAHYFFARHTVIDCWEKRQHKGYLFTIGDEMPYAVVSRHAVEALIGDRRQVRQGLTTPDIIAECQQRYHVFHIIPAGALNTGDARIAGRWHEYLGEHNVLQLNVIEHISELIGLVIGLSEGRVDMAGIRRDLNQLGIGRRELEALAGMLQPIADRAIRIRDTAVV